MRTGKKQAITGFGVTALFVLAFVIYWAKHFTTVVVTGPSMLPTFQSGERLLASRAYWLVGPIKRGDVVVVRGVEGESNAAIIKRVYRMGGDVVDLYNAPGDWRIDNGEYRVPPGEIYLLGDNRAASEDSRKFGAVPLSKVIGKVVLRP